MTEENGLKTLFDGPIGNEPDPAPVPPALTESDMAAKQLWVVRQDNVVHVDELCPFGKDLESRVIKHTNLTGGDPAFAGGELLWHDEQTIIVNGLSGRYGVRSDAEMKAVGKAFRESGYRVWSMGFDDETDLPLPFVGVTPQWIP